MQKKHLRKDCILLSLSSFCVSMFCKCVILNMCLLSNPLTILWESSPKPLPCGCTETWFSLFVLPSLWFGYVSEWRYVEGMKGSFQPCESYLSYNIHTSPHQHALVKPARVASHLEHVHRKSYRISNDDHKKTVFLDTLTNLHIFVSHSLQIWEFVCVVIMM